MSRWIENDAQWYEQRMLHCGCCGRLIAKHLLVADDGDQNVFCSEACEQLYRDYVLTERAQATGRRRRPAISAGTCSWWLPKNADTWNADYGAVYHLKEDPAGMAPHQRT